MNCTGFISNLTGLVPVRLASQLSSSRSLDLTGLVPVRLALAVQLTCSVNPLTFLVDLTDVVPVRLAFSVGAVRVSLGLSYPF